MPGLIPRPRHQPPNWADHVMIHSVQAAVCVTWISYMLLVLLGLQIGFGTMSAVYSPLHPILVVAMATMVIVGSIATLWGLISSTDRLDVAWKLHQSGLATAGAGWSIFAITYIVMPGQYWFSILIGVTQTAIALAGFIAALFVERTTRQTIRDQGLEA